MIRLAKYLKPFLPLILLSIVLLFVQAMADLSLPDYIAKIVNTGIQQGGVENAVPKAVRQSEMDKLTLFMSADEQADVLADYTLVDSESPDYAYLQEYPALATEPIYVLNSCRSGRNRHAEPDHRQSVPGGFRHRADHGGPVESAPICRRVPASTSRRCRRARTFSPCCQTCRR